VPLDVKSWLKRQTERTFTSQNAEIVRSVRERMDRESAEARTGAGMSTRARRQPPEIKQAEVDALKAQIITRAAALEPVIDLVLATVPEQRLIDALEARRTSERA
jgi:hypothetical protein